MAQVRQAVTEFGILPIGGSEVVHQNIPTHTKSILLYGQGLTLVHLSAQPKPFLTQKHTVNTP